MSREAAAQPPIPDDVPVVPAETAARLQAALDAWARQPAHRGVAAAVVLQDGAEWTGAAGLAGVGEPLRPEHLIGIASITKTMTGAVILQLVDEGVVRLDDPIGRWLAPIANVPPEITVRQLLNHTGGLANYTASAALGAAIAEEPARVFQPADLLAFLDAPHFAPGERTEYTNTAFLLLGLVAEAATGRPILELYHQRLWGPRHLTGVFMPFVEEPPAPVATALGRSGLVEPLTQPAVLSIGQSAFGLYADALTVARWGHALFLGDVVTPETQAAMRDLVPAAGNIPGESGAGLGIRGYDYFDRPEFGHSGGMSFGSSLLLFEPGSGATVVVLANQGPNAGHFFLAPELLGIVAGLP
ncbi:MAG: serine hydrolase domain-containing protein [Vicinamibacterales bacterium]